MARLLEPSIITTREEKLSEKTLSRGQVEHLWAQVVQTVLPPTILSQAALQMMEKADPNRLSFELGRMFHPNKFLDLSSKMSSATT